MINISLDKTKKYLLACSFGPDSMCLFDLLLKKGYDFAVAHVNYGLRPEAKEETEKLISYCEKHNIKCHVKFNANCIDRNIEEKCREIRYSFFEEIVKAFNYDAVLVAHNEDDCIETYLLQIKRKNIVNNYGLQEESVVANVRILRPLLHFSKFNLNKYNDLNNVPYAIDSSNLEDGFERNKIRHAIVEKMSDSERKRILLEIKNKNEEQTKRRKALENDSPVQIEKLLTLRDDDLAFYFTQCSRKFIPNIELSLKRVKEFKKIMMSEKANVISKIKGNVYFVKSYQNAYIKAIQEDLSFYFEINEPCEVDCEHFYLNFTKNSSNRKVKESDYPLIIRNASKNDIMIINGHKIKMRRQFINWKMPMELRNRWPIICNAQGKILYVPKYSTDFVPDLTTNFYVKI